MEETQDFIVSELMSELKSENTRKDAQLKVAHRIIAAIVLASFVAILATVGGFLWYLNQYDFSGADSTSYNAEGVYAIIDSEGNVVGTDFTADEITAMMEAINNGEGDED